MVLREQGRDVSRAAPCNVSGGCVRGKEQCARTACAIRGKRKCKTADSGNKESRAYLRTGTEKKGVFREVLGGKGAAHGDHSTPHNNRPPPYGEAD